MKLFLTLLTFVLWPSLLCSANLPDNEFFRAMNDEMQRTLKQLRLKDNPAPYYVAYWANQRHIIEASGKLGTLVPGADTTNDHAPVEVMALVSVGSDKQDALHFIPPSSNYENGFPIGVNFVPEGYNSIRQGLWQLTHAAYLGVADLYQAKQAYKRKKNIHDTLPDIVPSKSAHFVEEITPFEQPDKERLKETVKNLSALGKELSFLENFTVNIYLQRNDTYFLNSRGSFAQYMRPHGEIYLSASWRQPDGKKETVVLRRSVADMSGPSIEKMYEYTHEFLARIKQSYGAKSGETYIGPILLKPRAAERLLFFSVLREMEKVKPLLRGDRNDGDDTTVGKLNKKRSVRVSSNLLALYDRPLAREFEGVPLRHFSPLDDEGVATEDLTLIKDGYVKQVPLSQRPLTKTHRSNGHGFFYADRYSRVVQDLRERLTNVFVEPKEQLTDEQMEQKLLARCRELGLEYGYILHDGLLYGGNVLSLQRIYTADGHKEAVLNLKWDGNFFTQRDLRSVLAVGGKRELVDDYIDAPSVITPSILLSEVELVPKEHKPHRKPFVPRPQ